MSEGQLLDMFIEIKTWAHGLSNAHPRNESSDVTEALRPIVHREVGCSNFGLFRVDLNKAVLWPVLHSSGEDILRPVDLMANSALRYAVEANETVAFRAPIRLEDFLPPVSALLPLPSTGNVTQMLMLFDLDLPHSSLDDQRVDALRAQVSDLLALGCSTSGTSSAF